MGNIINTAAAQAYQAQQMQEVSNRPAPVASTPQPVETSQAPAYTVNISKEARALAAREE